MKYTCECVTAEKPVKPCNKHCWHFSKYGDVCVNCGNTGIQRLDPTEAHVTDPQLAVTAAADGAEAAVLRSE